MNGASTVNNTLRAAFSYCVQQVRSYDYHHYLCLLHLPPAVRRAAFTLRALNVETARAMDVASDPKIGLMRLLWWQEAIDKIYSRKLIEHPVPYIPADVAEKHGLLIRSGGGSEVRMESGEDLSDVVFEVASVAGAHLQKAREIGWNGSGRCRACASPGRACAGPLGFVEAAAVQCFRFSVVARGSGDISSLVSVEVEVACLDEQILK
uniref:NADH dehydrogenase (Ubiquinone) complex I, assembly factor 6 n=1 Tax=Ananas comosus var. bracteatus TaxID=296719 RepID=A0A6V7PKU6_ANACO|nr:unnamed protein product [Ananas comosus var. bracteatus]